MEEFFLALGDLPLHPLAVHFAVALFPVALIWLVTVTLSNKLRASQLGTSVILLALTVPLVFVAQQSGEALSDVLYEPEPHSEFGEMMMPIALATLALAAVFWFSLKKSWPKIASQILGFLTITAAFGATAMTVIVGHSGAAATWTGVVP